MTHHEVVDGGGAVEAIGAGAQPHPRPRKRVTADANEWSQLRRAKLDRQACRVCGTLRGLTLHHLVPRSLGGDDVPENLVPLCGGGTTGCHGKVEHRDKPTLWKLRHRLHDVEIAYITTRAGAYFLDRYYPAAPASA